MVKQAVKYLICVSVFATLFFILKREAKGTYNAYVVHDYHNTFHADASGYYVYLPAFFEYGFKDGFPSNQDSICGLGFSLKNDKVITKYTYGVSLLQSPFYLAGRAYNNLKHIEENGFSPFYMELMDWSGIFYGLAGFFLLYFSLLNFVKKMIAILALLFIFLGTNVFYYTLISAAYSHIYSFFLFSALVFLSIQLHKNYKLYYFILFSIVASLIVLIRPIDIIVLPLFLFIGNPQKISLLTEIKKWVNIKHIAILFSIGFILFLPQFIYWKFAYGSYLSYSYENEGFPYLLKPKVLAFLFAPLNGLIAYAPLYGIILLSVFFPRDNKQTSFAITVVILLLIYISASWHIYNFGCGFSGRNFVQYTAVLSIPFAIFLNRLKNIFAIILVYSSMILCVYATQNLSLNFDVCFWGKSEWDWKEYKYLLLSREKTVSFDLNKKNELIVKEPVIENNVRCLRINNEQYSNLINTPLSKLSLVPIRKIAIKLNAKAIADTAKFSFAIQVKRNGNIIYGNGVTTECDNTNWKEVFMWSQLPNDLEKTDELVLFFWDKTGAEFCVKDIIINYQ